MNAVDAQQSSVFVAIVGVPNVGKSSLLNHLVGEKTAIVTPKPQTTRTRVTGILTKGAVQYVFLDTPGILKPRNKLGVRMTSTVQQAVHDGDVTLMLFEPAPGITEAERELIQSLKEAGAPAIAAINKMDRVPDAERAELLAARRRELDSFGVFDTVREVSAATGEGCDGLLATLALYAAEGPHFFPSDSYTDQPEKQLVAEIIREKLLLNLQQEIPHGTAVEVETFHERKYKRIIDIDANIYCERKSHKGMIIGHGGQMLKRIATEAREDCETLLGSRVNLRCWVKVRSDWRDDENLLNRMGFAK